MSLYDSAWWSNTMAEQGTPTKNLNPDAVATWLLPLLYGDTDAAGTADTDGMPRLAVVDAAAVLAKTLGIDVDTARLDNSLGALLVDNMYRSDVRTGSAGDWGSTALAGQILAMFGQTAPEGVSARIAAEVPHALAMRDPAQLFTYTIPVLTAMSDSELRTHRQQTRVEISWIAGRLSAMSPMERLSAASSLKSVVAGVGSPPWSPAAVCGGLHESSGGLQTGSTATTDPQATAEAISVGCKLDITIPPWTMSGWPNDESKSGSAPASVAGLRIATSLGRINDYRALLVHQLTAVWLNPQATTPQNLDTLGVEMLGKLLDVRVPNPAGFQDQLTAALSTKIGRAHV